MLGIELLDRSTRPLVVTPAGQLYADFCRDVLRRKEEFEVALDQLKQEVEGTVRVASIYSVGLERDGRSWNRNFRGGSRRRSWKSNTCGRKKSIRRCWRIKPIWGW